MVFIGRRSTKQEDRYLSLSIALFSSSPDFHRADMCALNCLVSSYGYALMNFNRDARSSSRFYCYEMISNSMIQDIRRNIRLLTYLHGCTSHSPTSHRINMAYGTRHSRALVPNEVCYYCQYCVFSWRNRYFEFKNLPSSRITLFHRIENNTEFLFWCPSFHSADTVW